MHICIATPFSPRVGLLGSFAALVAALTLCWWTVPPVQPLGHCRKCGYNLTGNVSGQCPECGEVGSSAQNNERAYDQS